MNKHILKGEIFMKHLRIDDDRNGYFRRGDSWIVVTEMTKDDLLNLAHAAVEEEDFELDAYEDSKLPNAAHKIIYQKIWGQLTELHNRREAFQEEIRNIYKDAYQKYCSD